MGNSVAGATGVRSLPIVGAVSGSSPFAGKRRGGLADERRAAALDVTVDRMLIGACLRASKRLRATAPRLSAATLGWRGRTTPTLLLLLALLAMFNTSSAVALSILVVLPAAFRIWIVVLPTKPSPDEADRARARQGFAAEKQHTLFARTRAPSWRLETARRTRADPGLEVASQIGGGFLRPPLETERRNEAALLVHQINQRGVIHTVLAVVGRNLLGVDAIGFLHRVD